MASKFMNTYLDAKFTKGKYKHSKPNPRKAKLTLVSVDTKKAQKRRERLSKRATSKVSSIVDQEYSTNMHKKAISISTDKLIDDTANPEDIMYNDHGHYVDLRIDLKSDYADSCTYSDISDCNWDICDFDDHDL